MSDSIELQVLPTGRIRTIYKDERQVLYDALGPNWKVQRASNVEWEDGGWSVRAAHNPELAIRWALEPEEDLKFHSLTFGVSTEGEIVLFSTREEALLEETKAFFQLLPKETP